MHAIENTISLLKKADLEKTYATVGLDGFVDRIMRVVDKKNSDLSVSYIKDITSFSERIAKAAGKSAAIEKHVQQVKLGGNSPIMANAMAALGIDLTYIGALGSEGSIHPVFEPLSQKAAIINLCEAAKTDALEFNDGKLMFQEIASLDNITYDRIIDEIGEDNFIQLIDKSTFAAFNHWTALMGMNDIWKGIQERICPKISKRERKIFFDLADPAKRNDADIEDALEIISGFTPWYYTILGLNESESEHMCRVLDCEPKDSLNLEELMQARAEAIRSHMDIDCVTVHPISCAAAADRNGTAVVQGPYIAKPKISTGAGDHYNAGFCLGHILGGTLSDCLQTGVGVSGFYVRNAKSPTINDLAEFLESLA